MLTVLLFLLALPSTASPSQCKDLKPKQKIGDGPMEYINAALSAAQLATTGRAIQLDAKTSKAVTLLNEDALAKAWSLYQICLLREAGMVSQPKAEQLTEFVLTGGASLGVAAVAQDANMLHTQPPTAVPKPTAVRVSVVAAQPASEMTAVPTQPPPAPLADSGAAGGDWLSPTLQSIFVRIESGSFIMGSAASEADRRDDEREHKVTLSQPYYLMEHEVTQAEWKRIMGSNPSFNSGCDTCPVENVSWEDSVAFASKLSDQDGLIGNARYRLPSEAEWEYAARGGSTHAWSGSSNPSAVAWTAANSGRITHPTCQLERNGYGLCDMSGNVFEWVADWYGEYPSDKVTDPLGPSTGSARVRRGGNRTVSPGFARVAARFKATGRDSGLGFRLVRSE
jgi:formylglycine-generating enzyme required for sulfatase activity